eukprot:TRINITY_DN9278_c0_g1_i2.p7 TRINITY_DN9278_c0_g1~~TRINITY_DN9278_c0_g1_i2.p7  ORF type:complete len:142 (+),score=10.54 TRINITY_DN9278_c0_g1_i2:5348-5773(+)
MHHTTVRICICHGDLAVTLPFLSPCLLPPAFLRLQIGVGKNLLCVDGLEREAIQALSPVHLHQGGDSFPLVGTSGRTLGAAVRCVNTSTNPVFVSIGHKVTLATAVAICCKTARHKLPEPVRQADLRSRDYLKQREEQASS